MKKFFKKNWDRILSLLLIVAAMVIYICNFPESEGVQVAFTILMILSVVALFFKKKIERTIAGIVIPLANILFLLLSGAVWYIVCAGVLVVIFLLKVMISINEAHLYVYCSIFLLLWITFVATLCWDAIKENDITHGTVETVVLKEVDIKPDGNVYVSIDGKGIFKVQDRKNTFNYQAGDTVEVILSKNRVIFSEI